MKIIRIQIEAHVVEQILKNGYMARGGFTVEHGLPEDASLAQAHLSETSSGAVYLSLYFQCAGDGFEDRKPKLRA